MFVFCGKCQLAANKVSSNFNSVNFKAVLNDFWPHGGSRDMMQTHGSTLACVQFCIYITTPCRVVRRLVLFQDMVSF